MARLTCNGDAGLTICSCPTGPFAGRVYRMPTADARRSVLLGYLPPLYQHPVLRDERVQQRDVSVILFHICLDRSEKLLRTGLMSALSALVFATSRPSPRSSVESYEYAVYRHSVLSGLCPMNALPGSAPVQARHDEEDLPEVAEVGNPSTHADCAEGYTGGGSDRSLSRGLSWLAIPGPWGPFVLVGASSHIAGSDMRFINCISWTPRDKGDLPFG